MEILIEFLFGNGEQSQMIGGLAVAGIAQGVGALFGAFSAGKRRRQAEREARRAEKEISYLENNRQDVINPYANITDLSSTITNPYENLQVATQAAEFQADQTDLSLASTLDTLRATGAGAGGATALAQEAARAKQGIAASIEQQEAQNNRLRARGESEQQQLMLTESRRVQEADARGKQFVFGATENREMQKLNRVSGQQEQYMAQQASAQTAMDSSLGSLFGTAASYAAFSYKPKQ